MSEFYFENRKQDSYPNFENKLILWIWNPEETPPHIGISFGLNYFSLSVKGKEHKQVDSLVKQINRKKNPLLFIELNFKLELTQIISAFNAFETVGEGNTTCSSPIFKVLSCNEEVKTLHNLLEFIHNGKRVKSTCSVHLPVSFKQIPKYTLAKIHQKIRSLENGTKS